MGNEYKNGINLKIQKKAPLGSANAERKREERRGEVAIIQFFYCRELCFSVKRDRHSKKHVTIKLHTFFHVCCHRDGIRHHVLLLDY
jgi:hypothetical protein